jgi:hypothetical protein
LGIQLRLLHHVKDFVEKDGLSREMDGGNLDCDQEQLIDFTKLVTLFFP